MLHRTVAVSLAAAFLIGCGGDAAEEAPPAEMSAAATPEMAIAEVADYWETHYNMGHADMVASRYTEDAWALQADGGYQEGRAAIEANLAAGMENSPQVSINSLGTMVFGDMAASMGTYTLEVAGEDGATMSWGGAYLNMLTNESGEWRIQGSIVNYDAAPAEDWVWAEPGEAPPNEGTMGEMVDYFQTHWNMGHPDMVADLFKDDALVAYSNGPVLRGRAAVEADIATRIEAGGVLEINEVGTVPMGDGWAMDGGWYTVSAPDGGDMIATGSFLQLLEQQDDGSWLIQWAVTNQQPPPPAM